MRLEELAASDRPVDQLHHAIVDYLGRVSLRRLTEAQSARLVRLITVANEIEQIADLVTRDVVVSSKKRLDDRVVVSAETRRVIERFHDEVSGAMRGAVDALGSGDPERARAVRDSKSRIRELTHEIALHSLERLTAQAPHRVKTYTREVELVEILDDIFRHARHIAQEIRRWPAMDKALLDWLMTGDVSVAYQVARDLLGEDRAALRARIPAEGWGRAVARCPPSRRTLGAGFLLPEMDLDPLHPARSAQSRLPADARDLRESVDKVLDELNAGRPGGKSVYTDTCINGMVLNYASWFGADGDRLAPVVDYLIDDQMRDGGFNCQRIRSGARHSSLHSTLSVLEGIAAFQAAGHGYRADELERIAEAAREFVLMHRFYRSDHTGAVINKAFLSFPVCPRWYYNILRGLDHFAAVGAPYDRRMEDALDEILRKRRPDGRWNANAAKSGEVHFTLEKAGQPSRLVTLGALRVLKAYRPEAV